MKFRDGVGDPSQFLRSRPIICIMFPSQDIHHLLVALGQKCRSVQHSCFK